MLINWTTVLHMPLERKAVPEDADLNGEVDLGVRVGGAACRL